MEESNGFTLDFAVDLNGLELAPAGAVVDDDSLRDLINDAPSVDRSPMPLFELDGSRALLRQACASPTYERVFGGLERVDDLLNTLSRATVPSSLAEPMRWLQMHDLETFRHNLQVYALSVQVAAIFGADTEEMDFFLAAGPCHDIGKICVPHELLTKRGDLSEEDRLHLGHHASAGRIIMSYLTGDPDSPAARAAADHHERADGSGYQRGIRLRSRALELIAACDIYDALVSPRAYRSEAFDNRAALEELTDLASRSKLGWSCVRALIAANRRPVPDPDTVKVPDQRRLAAPERHFI